MPGVVADYVRKAGEIDDLDAQRDLIVKAAPIPMYDYAAPEHQERLAIIAQERDHLHERLTDTSEDSYVDRAELRRAIGVTHDVEAFVKQGQSVSLTDLTHEPFDPEDAPNYRGAWPHLSTLEQRLEATGYHFIPDEPMRVEQLKEVPFDLDYSQHWHDEGYKW